MKYLVRVRYKGGRLSITSEPSWFSVSSASSIAVSRSEPGAPEAVEAVGRTAKELAPLIAAAPEGFRKQSIRVFDPMAADSFEGMLAGRMIRFYIYQRFGHQFWSNVLRARLRMLRFTFAIEIPHYQSVDCSEQKAFEREVRSIPGFAGLRIVG